jgi:hypothetical protein
MNQLVAMISPSDNRSQGQAQQQAGEFTLKELIEYAVEDDRNCHPTDQSDSLDAQALDLIKSGDFVQAVCLSLRSPLR